MKLKEIIQNIDKSSDNESYVNIYEFLDEFGIIYIDYTEDDKQRLKAFYYAKWLCTDSWVGGRAYFLDDVLVATSWQSGRKMDENFFWVSQDDFNKVGDYLRTLCVAYSAGITTANLDLELGEGLGSAQFELPSVIGMPLDEAKVQIVGAGLKVGQVMEIAAEEGQIPGTVVKQNPESGGKVRIGDVIDLWVIPAGAEPNATNGENTQP